jgi:hypothetical protein
MSNLVKVAAMVGLLAAGRAMADPVWDPTEIARLSQQAAQLAANLSATITTLQTFDKLATEVGAVGARTSFHSTAPNILAHYAALQSGGTPTGASAIALLSATPLVATHQQQDRQIWQAAYLKVAAEGLAVSQVATQDAAAAVGRSKALASGASSAQDLRGDLQANSAVGLALLSELGSVEAVLALLLEQQSLARLTIIANGGASL